MSNRSAVRVLNIALVEVLQRLGVLADDAG